MKELLFLLVVCFFPPVLSTVQAQCDTLDYDCDGYIGPIDCNQTDGAIHPGASEICNLVDDDCDGQTDEGLATPWFADFDGDGYGAGNIAFYSCFAIVNTVANNADCNDAVATAHPGAQEICNGGDDDCDGLTDNSDPSVTGQMTYYADIDGDGYGAGAAMLSCTQAVNTSTNDDDCNNVVATINPGAQEICNGNVDDDCNNLADNTDPSVTGQSIYYSDYDNDGYGSGAGFTSCGQDTNTSPNDDDCNNFNAAINPGAQEICNSSLDDDCDGLADDSDPSVIGQGVYYTDTDNDGYGAGEPLNLCVHLTTVVTNNTDCNDTNSSINLQGTYYTDIDGDGYGTGSGFISCPEANTSANDDDCNDTNAAINPGAEEICNNGVDENCDNEDCIFVDAINPENMSAVVYPNPAGDVITVETQETKSVDVLLWSIDGTLLSQEQINTPQKFILDLSGLSSDTYLIQIISAENKKIYTQKIVKQ